MQITIKDIGIFLWKNLRLILTAGLLTTVLGAGITCSLAAPEYTATAKLYVSNEKSNSGYISQGDLAVSKSLVDTCLILAESTPVLEEAVQKLAVTYPDLSVKEVAELLTGGSIRNTEAFSLSVTDPDRQKAADIVNTIVALLPAEIMRVTKAASVEIIEIAGVPAEDDYSWPVVRNGVMGGVIGLLAAVGFVLVSGNMDTTVYGRKELARQFRIPVIGAIPGKVGRAPVLLEEKADPYVTDAYRLAAAHIAHAENCRKIAVTSAVSGEGKSCCAKNLAKMLTQAGCRVLLTDGDSLNRGSGSAEAAQAYDYIILDTTALLAAADAAVLSDRIDGYILSVAAGVSNVEKIKEAVWILEQLNANILGFVVHNVAPETEKYGRYIRWKNKGIRVK